MYWFWGLVLLIGLGNRLLALKAFLPRERYTRILQGEDVPGKLQPDRYSATAALVAEYITVPAVFGSHCQQPIGWCTIPPRAHMIPIATFVVINLVFCAINYRTFPNNF